MDAPGALDDLAKSSLATSDAEIGMFLPHRLVLDVTRPGWAQAGMERQRLTEALGWVTGNYAGLLAAMGRAEAEIAVTLQALRREVGLDPG